jgi:hypothetical protein
MTWSSVCRCAIARSINSVYTSSPTRIFLRRAGLLLTPRYISRGLLLHHAEDLSGNTYDMFTHLYPLPSDRSRMASPVVLSMHEFASLPAYVRRAGAGTCRACLPISGCFSSLQTLTAFMDNLKLLVPYFRPGNHPREFTTKSAPSRIQLDLARPSCHPAPRRTHQQAGQRPRVPTRARRRAGR